MFVLCVLKITYLEKRRRKLRERKNENFIQWWEKQDIVSLSKEKNPIDIQKSLKEKEREKEIGMHTGK